MAVILQFKLFTTLLSTGKLSCFRPRLIYSFHSTLECGCLSRAADVGALRTTNGCQLSVLRTGQVSNWPTGQLADWLLSLTLAERQHGHKF